MYIPFSAFMSDFYHIMRIILQDVSSSQLRTEKPQGELLREESWVRQFTIYETNSGRLRKVRLCLITGHAWLQAVFFNPPLPP